MTDLTALRELADIQVGFAFKSARFTKDSSATRLLRGDNIGQGRLRWDGVVSWPDSDVDDRYALREGDLVIAMDRPWIDAGLKFASVTKDDLPSYLVQRVARLRAKEGVDQRFLKYVVASPEFTSYVLSVQTGTAVPHISGGQILQYPAPALDSKYQRAIAEVLGALDDKIAVNDRSLSIMRDLARAMVVEPPTRSETTLFEICSMIVRGVTPRYVQNDGLMVLNQKCIRDHRVDLAPARMTESSVQSGRKLLCSSDLLVNSTGQGTLGRVARWTVEGLEATVDSHVTILRFDPTKVDVAFAGVRALELEDHIAGLAEGSTGQTELKRDLLGAIELTLPALDAQRTIGKSIRAFDVLSESYRTESRRLAETRDQLLPLLMSGRILVKDAEKTVEKVL